MCEHIGGEETTVVHLMLELPNDERAIDHVMWSVVEAIEATGGACLMIGSDGGELDFDEQDC